MAFITQQKKKTAQETIKKFCPMCFNAGLPEETYTNHFLRETPDPSSKVVCPTLLAVECRHCHEPGHTVGYCPYKRADKENEKEKDKDKDKEKEKEKEPREKPLAMKKPANMFLCLGSDDEDEDTFAQARAKKEKAKKTKAQKASEFPEFPAFPASDRPRKHVLASASASMPSYASALLNPVVKPKPKPPPPVPLTVFRE